MAVLEVLGALGGAASMLAGASSRRRQRRSERRQLGTMMEGFKANKAHLTDIQRRQDLALGDQNIGLEGQVMQDKQRNLDTDQAAQMGDIDRRIKMAEEGRSNLQSLQGLENAQSVAGIVGNSAYALQQMIPQQPDLAQQLAREYAAIPQMAGVSSNGLMASLATQLIMRRGGR